MIYELTVKPGAKREEITVENDHITIRTPARPHDGEANAAILKILAKHFRVPKTSIKILRGQTSHKKLIELP